MLTDWMWNVRARESQGCQRFGPDQLEMQQPLAVMEVQAPLGRSWVGLGLGMAVNRFTLKMAVGSWLCEL